FEEIRPAGSGRGGLHDPRPLTAVPAAARRLGPQPRAADRDRRAQRAAQDAGLRCRQGIRAQGGRADRQERAISGSAPAPVAGPGPAGERVPSMSEKVPAPPEPPGSYPYPESLVIVTGLSGSGKSYVNKCL